ncbi:nucleotidyltransferase domain-containing protein [Candidatus Pacearchaeota archaeon]|nr:nucleotidyltransferase domain-containing protein [Candidatus Pacearchaeota archaeon]
MNEAVLKINKIVSELSEILDVSAIFIFGSRATGKARKDSDYDLAVLTKNSSEETDLEIMSYGDEMIDISLFSRLPLIIQFNVLKEGKLIYCRDKKEIYDLKVKILRSYLDFSSFMKRFYTRLINNV